MITKRGYSSWVIPILYVFDLLIIYALCTYFFSNESTFTIVSIVSIWLVLSVFFSFHKIYRYRKIINILSKIIKQVFVYSLMIMSFFFIFKNESTSAKSILNFILGLFIILNIWSVFLHQIFKRYRLLSGNSFIKTIIIGSNKLTNRLEFFLKNDKYHNFKYAGFFTDKDQENKLGNFNECFKYIIREDIDEIFCSVKELSNDQITQLINFSDNNLKTLKFIPDNKYIFSKKLKYETYDLTPILSLREIPLKNSFNKVVKRAFDIVFSLLVILGFLSWFTPLLAIAIKLESNGEIFFKQMRYGADFNLFACYKFRSMMANKESDKKQASKNDMRVTRIGKFIRKTSIDELPQFYNVLFGNMSVVGPRPLLLSHTDDYKNKINKFMVRHTVKPGITGLAQVSGYRGNIEKDLDMLNRVRYDIFYVDNWSLYLDLKIIIKTVVNVIKGEEKAY